MSQSWALVQPRGIIPKMRISGEVATKANADGEIPELKKLHEREGLDLCRMKTEAPFGAIIL